MKSLSGGLDLDGLFGMRSHVHLPLLPRPLGFLINALAYAVIFGIALLSMKLLIRHLRIRRGKCASCGYNLADLKICPECGLPAKPRTMPQ